MWTTWLLHCIRRIRPVQPATAPLPASLARVDPSSECHQRRLTNHVILTDQSWCIVEGVQFALSSISLRPQPAKPSQGGPSVSSSKWPGTSGERTHSLKCLAVDRAQLTARRGKLPTHFAQDCLELSSSPSKVLPVLFLLYAGP